MKENLYFKCEYYNKVRTSLHDFTADPCFQLNVQSNKLLTIQK